ncbi:hypothetical protein [Curvivirga sp.]|uniref:hypothetical protein n=1 Tax=Curvivirga sp. TaxID=2856848 RepID=UPI003B596066
MLKHILTILSFMVITFIVQGGSHFVVNKEHFDAITFTRAEPIMELGFLVMFIEGAILSVAFHTWTNGKATIKRSLLTSYAFGTFLISYIAFTEPAKYTVDQISNWMIVEGIVGIIQFGLFGFVMAGIHIKFMQKDTSQ